MNPRPIPAAARRTAAAGPGRSGRPRTITVVYESAHLRVRVSGGAVLWFVRDVAAALGFRLPLTPGGAAPQVLVTTAELCTVMAAGGFSPPVAFTAWAAQLPHRLPGPGASPASRR